MSFVAKKSAEKIRLANECLESHLKERPARTRINYENFGRFVGYGDLTDAEILYKKSPTNRRHASDTLVTKGIWEAIIKSPAFNGSNDIVSHEMRVIIKNRTIISVRIKNSRCKWFIDFKRFHMQCFWNSTQIFTKLGPSPHFNDYTNLLYLNNDSFFVHFYTGEVTQRLQNRLIDVLELIKSENPSDEHISVCMQMIEDLGGRESRNFMDLSRGIQPAIISEGN